MDKIITKEWWINELDGVDGLLDMVLSGQDFSPLGYLYLNFEISDFLPTEEPLNRDRVQYCNDIDGITDLTGYNVYYITK